MVGRDGRNQYEEVNRRMEGYDVTCFPTLWVVWGGDRSLSHSPPWLQPGQVHFHLLNIFTYRRMKFAGKNSENHDSMS